MKTILDASNCNTNEEIINLIEKDIKRRHSIGFKIKKFFQRVF